MTASNETTSNDTSAKAPDPAAPQFILSRWLFLRVLALVYVFAFGSMIPQIVGLIGEDGIGPVQATLFALGKALGPMAVWMFPTVAWLNYSDAFLYVICWGGVVFALTAMVGFLTVPSLAICWFLYLSIVNIGGPFLSFQWDALLLEAGFLAIFFAPLQLFERPWRGATYEAPTPNKLFLWLYYWLLFRVVFQSGACKLASGDPNWRNLTGLEYHFWSQPLPTPGGWWVGQLPNAALQAACVGLFFFELVVPFLIFAPRRFRLIGAAMLIFLQAAIAFTGNYTFFNLLTAAFAILLLDDTIIKRALPKKFGYTALAPSKNQIKRGALAALGALLIFCSSIQCMTTFVGYERLHPAAMTVLNFVEPYRLTASYGVFAIMTTRRLEIVIEGSNDGNTWQAYEFPFKPGDVKRPPPWVAPYQPRLDWQMWFAALSSFQENRWFLSMIRGLLLGKKPVLALLSHNPFPNEPPKFIRAVGYDYHFSTIDELMKTGAWWRRVPKGLYLPQVSLRQNQ